VNIPPADTDGETRARFERNEILMRKYLSNGTWRGVLMIAASLAVSLEEWQAAARFYGAAEAATEIEYDVIKFPTDGKYKFLSRTIDEAYLTCVLVKTRTALGMTAFEAAKAAGRAMALEAAAAEARVWLQGGTV
jgi:hypothetical protein